MLGKRPPKSLDPNTGNSPAPMYSLSQCSALDALTNPGQGDYKVAGRYHRAGRKAGVGPNGEVHGHQLCREQAEKVRLGWDLVKKAGRDWQVHIPLTIQDTTGRLQLAFFTESEEQGSQSDAERFSGKHEYWLWRKQNGKRKDPENRFWWRFPQYTWPLTSFPAPRLVGPSHLFKDVSLFSAWTAIESPPGRSGSRTEEEKTE